MKRPVLGGFTLLEVMVAVAILGISMVAIFGSQAGAIRAGARARHITTATLLARCKMGEIEELLATEGFPVIGEEGEDECCEGGEQEGFTCDWSIERVELPDSVDLGEEGDGDPLGLGGSHSADSASGMDLENALTGAAGGDMIGNYAVQYAWPVLRPQIEDQVRRVTVTVKWGEGSSERSFDVSQYVVAEQGSEGPDLSGGAAAPGTGAPATGGSTGIPRVTLPSPGQGR
ncbi:prepilin-type N-terminal cleavage/methylation domain-containing protein [bacterium AH-315-N03]|nr:prepilin-type N-terminal cleavage/methylation domain-containing protein [bacterium AH-315-N03]